MSFSKLSDDQMLAKGRGCAGASQGRRGRAGAGAAGKTWRHDKQDRLARPISLPATCWLQSIAKPLSVDANAVS
jgi:hypothetical protein